MKIVLFIDGLGFGGAQRQIVNLAVELKRGGHEIEFLCYNRDKNNGFCSLNTGEDYYSMDVLYQYHKVVQKFCVSAKPFCETSVYYRLEN